MTPESALADESTASPLSQIESRISDVGHRLRTSLTAVLEATPGVTRRPQDLADSLGIDKVLSSRILKVTRHRDPMAVVNLAPGPEPLRRMLRAARKSGTTGALVDKAETAVDDFEHLIRTEAGDRSALDAILSAWLPEARTQFEIRRKQAAFRAMSELKGARVEVNLATVILNPSDDGKHIDVVWIMALLGLRRLRPKAPVKFATRRQSADTTPRAPTTLTGTPVEGMNGVRLDRFCDAPPAPIDTKRVGDVTHYVLDGGSFGPRSAVDLVIAEVNMQELPLFHPDGKPRRGHVFAEIPTPCKALVFDAFVHRDVYRGSTAELFVYDTALDGVADVSDPKRDIDRLDLLESVDPLGRGFAAIRVTEIPNYLELMRYVFTELGWDEQAFRGYRCRSEYPLYGSQFVMAFG